MGTALAMPLGILVVRIASKSSPLARSNNNRVENYNSIFFEPFLGLLPAMKSTYKVYSKNDNSYWVVAKNFSFSMICFKC